METAKAIFEDPDALYARANGYLAQGMTGRAELIYRKLLKTCSPGQLASGIPADILHNLGMIAETKNNEELAIYYYHQAVARNYRRKITWLFLVRLYINRFRRLGNSNDYLAGRQALQQAKSIDPNHPGLRVLEEELVAMNSIPRP